MLVTIYKNIFDTKGGVDIDIADVLEAIRSGKYEIDVGRIRQTEDKGVRDELKKKLPNFTACGTFKTRKNSDLVKHSGLIAIDFDNIPQDEIVEFKNELCADAYTYAVFYSVSGRGLCCLVKIDPAKFADAFLGLQNYYFNKYEKVIDPVCKDLSRARTVSYDPNLFNNTASLKFREYLPAVKRGDEQKIKGFLHLHDKFEKILYTINSDICTNYSDWFKVGMALANHYQEKGLEYFKHISQFRQSSKKDFDKLVYKQYEYCLNSKDKSIDIGTLYYFIKQAGYSIRDESSELIASYVYHHKRAKLTQDSSVKNIMTYVAPGSKLDEVQKIVKTVYEDNTYNPLLSAKDEDESIFDDILIWLKASYDLKRNEITKAIDNNGVELEEEDLNTMYIEAKKLFSKITYENLFRVINSTHTQKYNPVKEYLESIIYDGDGHIKKLAKSITSDTGTEAWRYRMLKRWLVGIIESVYGGRSVLMLVLTGKQRTGKCLGKGTPILMHDMTIKKVEDIKVGDKLMGINGSIRNVLSTTSGVEQMYLVKQKNGIDYRVNESHILSLRDRHTKVVKNISVLDYLNLGKTQKNNLYGYKARNLNNVDSKLLLAPYFLGLWLGDGVSRHPTIENMDIEIIKYLYQYARELGLSISIYENKGSKSKGYSFVSAKGSGNGGWHNNKAKEGLKHYNLLNNKHIPYEYMNSSFKQRLELIAGFIDTDGSYSKRDYCYEITQKRENLIDQLSLLCASVGIKTNKTSRIIKGRKYFRISLGGNVHQLPIKIERKKPLTSPRPMINLQTEIEVVKENIDTYYGFEIDGDKLFCLGDFTVTHNTEFFLRLLPDKLKKYFGASQLDHGKDSELLMTQKLVIFDDEYGGKSKQDAKRMKMLLSADSFSLRAPYGKKNADFKRLAVFCGTSNDEEILNDGTGNRRIIVFNVTEQLDFELYNSIDKEQLFAEALLEFKTGTTSAISAEDQEMMDKATFEKHYQATSEAEMVTKFFIPSTKSDNGLFMMVSEIKDHIEKNSKQLLWIGKLSTELKRLGFKRTYSNKHKRIGYWVQKLSQDIDFSDYGTSGGGKTAASGDDLPY